jgi:phage baseplate assembly protein W
MSFDLKIKSGDISLESSGEMSIVSGNGKIRQDIVKIILTKIGENRFHPQYGSNTGQLQIGTILDQALIEEDLKQSAQSAIRYLMQLQREQSRRQLLSSSEIILDIKNIAIERDETDPRMYNIFISVLTQKLESIDEVITIRII